MRDHGHAIAGVAPLATGRATTSTRAAAPLPRLRALIEHPRVQAAIVTLIVLNAVLLGLETSTVAMTVAGPLVASADRLLLAVFCAEIGARLLVYRAAFWRDPWSVFDFSVVAIALLPAAGPFAVLRALRVLRVLRLLTMVPSMRRVVGALLAAIPGLGSIVLVLGIVFYVFAVVATNLFADSYPEWFGHLGLSLYTLFQIMTLESWSMGIARPVMETFPHAWAFFVPFILIATFTMLNLFIAIIVNAMQTYGASEQPPEEGADTRTATELGALREEVRELRALLIDLRGVPVADRSAH